MKFAVTGASSGFIAGGFALRCRTEPWSLELRRMIREPRLAELCKLLANAASKSRCVGRLVSLSVSFLPCLAHLVVTSALFVLIARQYLSYGVTTDPDPDSYVTYAAYLDQHAQLKAPSQRLPGYPLFLVLCSRILGSDYHHSVFYVQLGILLALGAAVHIWLLRRFGHVAALAFTTILAAPSFLVAQAALMLPDFVYAALFVPTIYFLTSWLLERRQRWFPALVTIGTVLFVLYNLRPTTSVLITLYLVAVTVVVRGEWSRKLQRGFSDASFRPFLLKTAACMMLLVAVSVLIDRFVDTGAKSYNLNVLRARVIYVTSPAGDSEHERAIEIFRARVEQETGQPIESLVWRLRADSPDTTHVHALARLRAHPEEYVASVFNSLRWSHYLLLRHVVPYFPYVSLGFDYPPLERTTKSRIFRATGFLLHEGFWVMALKFIGTWALLIIGARELSRVYPVLVRALILVCVGYWVLLAAVASPEGRYLLPFVVPVYVAQAVGIARIFDWLVAMTRRRTSLREGGSR